MTTLEDAERQFALDLADVRLLAEKFAAALQSGLEGKPSGDMAMIPTYSA